MLAATRAVSEPMNSTTASATGAFTYMKFIRVIM